MPPLPNYPEFFTRRERAQLGARVEELLPPPRPNPGLLPPLRPPPRGPQTGAPGTPPHRRSSGGAEVRQSRTGALLAPSKGRETIPGGLCKKDRPAELCGAVSPYQTVCRMARRHAIQR